MPTLLAGGSAGVFSIDAQGAHAEAGAPPSVAFLCAGEPLWALTAQGALWQRDAQAGWRLIAEQTVPDEPWSFAADRRLPGRLYIGVSPAGVYRSDDGGLSWTACDSLKRLPGYETWTFPPPPHIPHVRSIAPDPDVAGGLYIGVEEGGVFRSPDGGDTWQSINEGLYWDVHTVSPRGSELFATTGAGFHRSSDGGAHWQHVTTGIPNRYTVPFLTSQANPARLFTAAAAGPPPTWRGGVEAGIFRSDDAGEHWRRLETGLPQRFDVMINALTEDGEGKLYASAGSVVYVSEDSGESWRLLAGDLQGIRSLAVV